MCVHGFAFKYRNTLKPFNVLRARHVWKWQKGYGLLNIRFRSTFSLQYGHICFFPTMHQPLMQNSWNLGLELRLNTAKLSSSYKVQSNLNGWEFEILLQTGTDSATMQQTAIAGEVIVIEALGFTVLVYNLKVTRSPSSPLHCWLRQVPQKLD